MQYRDPFDFVCAHRVLRHKLTVVVGADNKLRRNRIAEHKLCAVVHTGHLLLNRNHRVTCKQSVFIGQLRRYEAGVECFSAEIAGQEEHLPVSRGVVRVQRSVFVLNAIVQNLVRIGIRRLGLCACGGFRDEIGLNLDSAKSGLCENTPASVGNNL